MFGVRATMRNSVQPADNEGETVQRYSFPAAHIILGKGASIQIGFSDDFKNAFWSLNCYLIYLLRCWISNNLWGLRSYFTNTMLSSYICYCWQSWQWCVNSSHPGTHPPAGWVPGWVGCWWTKSCLCKAAYIHLSRDCPPTLSSGRWLAGGAYRTLPYTQLRCSPGTCLHAMFLYWLYYTGHRCRRRSGTECWWRQRTLVTLRAVGDGTATASAISDSKGSLTVRAGWW